LNGVCIDTVDALQDWDALTLNSYTLTLNPIRALPHPFDLKIQSSNFEIRKFLLHLQVMMKLKVFVLLMWKMDSYFQVDLYKQAQRFSLPFDKGMGVSGMGFFPLQSTLLSPTLIPYTLTLLTS